ncbi:MAG: hypothetical protein IJU26_00740 [Synergistaceae bacterium]|nr:hypothetical protein [Synergistaceae bacterium]
MQPVSMLMSNLNLESAAKISPNALAAAQDTGQSQEIVREGIRAVQTVQASDAAAQAQRVHRKNAGDEQKGQGRQGRDSRDSFEHTETKHEEQGVSLKSVPLIEKKARSMKSFDFTA